MTKLFKHLAVAVTACAALAGCATRPEPPRMAARTPARQAPAVRAEAPEPSNLVAQASAFEAFMRHGRRIDPAFSGPADVSQALQTGAAHEPHELEAGMIAYAALAALQEPRFVAAVRADRSDLARRIAADPQAALALAGADAAEARASGALYAEGSALSGEGEKIKHAAYSVQHQAWANAKVPDPAGRLSRVKRLSTESYRPAREDAAELQMSLAGAARRSGAASPVVARGVALAALSVLGEARQGQNLMSEPRTTSCLHMAKLNLYQCLASAGPHYEDIYCLGQHAMIDPGQCVVEATQIHNPAARQAAVTRTTYGR
ncbi:hypothetical protein [Phenylobacterium sp.]|jgi:hypothetical protein|uniref:hypothetical protein n=1 Tax=Phenylobacterium sp. TaxID=1871053 RepID=UPI002E330A3F|nr:hypothetical protein [Phenylobacterium sp.]HEX3363537.1 hypothetical protein [Phenylobacterium sp.]